MPHAAFAGRVSALENAQRLDQLLLLLNFERHAVHLRHKLVQGAHNHPGQFLRLGAMMMYGTSRLPI
jgi:hypothetical protein